MILINDDIWIQVNDFEDVSNVIREYYNEDLADVLDEIVKKNEVMISDLKEEKEALLQEIDDLSDCIGERENRINEYSIQVEKLEDEISELKGDIERNENC